MNFVGIRQRNRLPYLMQRKSALHICRTPLTVKFFKEKASNGFVYLVSHAIILACLPVTWRDIYEILSKNLLCFCLQLSSVYLILRFGNMSFILIAT